MPCLSDRRNIVVIADEAHRSQYDFIDGFARHMRDALPNASFIGFTGTPIELTDKNTRAVFGDYISIYDIQRAVLDKATVPIYYESRLAKLELDEAERPKIDPDFEEATEGEEIDRKEKLKSKWAQLEAVVGAGKRFKLIARDIVDHFESRAEAMLRQTQDEGKAMIVDAKAPLCFVARHRPAGAVAAAVKTLIVAEAAHDIRARPHAAGNDAHIAFAGAHRAFARNENLSAVMFLERHVIVMAIDSGFRQ